MSFDISQFIDLQYSVGLILIARFMFNYSPLKNVAWVTNHKQYCVYLLGTVLAGVFMVYAWCCQADVKFGPMAWKLLLSYTVATSIYEVAAQKVFEMAEKVFGVNSTTPPAPPAPPAA